MPSLMPLQACFLTDHKQSTKPTIVWKSSKLGELATHALESLIPSVAIPSGVKIPDGASETTHFKLNGYLGMSAFSRRDSPSAAAISRYIALSVLVSPSYDLWSDSLFEYTNSLHVLLAKVLESDFDTRILDSYLIACYNKYESLERPSLYLDQFSDDPVNATTELLDRLGPFIFPLYRSGLIAPRILFFTQTDIELSCKFTSILGNLIRIPGEVKGWGEHRETNSVVPFGFRPDFEKLPQAHRCVQSIGVENTLSGHWIGCTSDSDLAQDFQKWDILVNIPKPFKLYENSSIEPSSIIRSSAGIDIKPNERDYRRFNHLRQNIHELVRYYNLSDSSSPLCFHGYLARDENIEKKPQAHQPRTESGVTDEWLTDTNMLLACDDLEPGAPYSPFREAFIEVGECRLSRTPDGIGTIQARLAYQYFPKLTEKIFAILGDLVRRSSYRDTLEASAKLQMTRAELVSLGLAGEDQNDQRWLRELTELYFDRKLEFQIQ